MYLYNFHAIEESLLAKSTGLTLYYSEPLGPRSKKILLQALQLGIEAQKIDRKELAALDPNQECRGLAAKVADASLDSAIDFDELLVQLNIQIQNGELPLLVALDGVTDPHNLGAIIRSADKLPAQAVLIPQRRSASDGPVVQSSSAGAINHVPLITVNNLNRALERLKEAGFWIWGAEMGGNGMHTLDAKIPLVLVMGSEGKGISPLIRRNCDRLVSITTGGHVDSLNVSNACAIMLYEAWRQRDFKFP